MRFGFVIDQSRCIGCHACTVACKEEHDIPIGVNRTWVKYIEKGSFPDVSRHFAVLRCNHCDDAPCIEICPTVALFRRRDGIVDFDGERCIGCKSCMQACPYDALYIDPNKNTAAKCNFDASRVERGYKPACEAVCPTQAILSGDLDDPASAISRTLASRNVSVRKPEKGTRPKLFYAGVDRDLLDPARMAPQAAYFWAEKPPGEDLYALRNGNGGGSSPGAAREVYDVPHPQPWGKKIAAYLWTKSIAAGVLIVAAVLTELGHRGDEALLHVAGPAIALVFLAATLLLLVVDLKRPDRFHYLLIKPNLRSWLVLGGYILSLYGAAAFVWLVYGNAAASVPAFIVRSAALLGVASACYSAFLFAQARGRDLWQSRLLIWHLLAQALSAGAATLIVAGVIFGATHDLLHPLGRLLMISLILGMALILGEISVGRGSVDRQRATELLKKGSLNKPFWLIAVGLGFVAPLALLVGPGLSPTGYLFAALFTLTGLWTFEDLWIKAGQSAPLS